MRILAFTKYDREAASTRQRLLQYLPTLSAAGIEVDYRPLLDDAYVRSLATGARASKLAILSNYVRRLWQLRLARHYDLVWIYAELFPYLPTGFERLAFGSGCPIVYDFDDAFFVPYETSSNPLVRRLLADKLKPLIAGAAAATCGNAYLQDYAQPLCKHTLVVPTVVDTDAYLPAPRANEAPLTIGWIGSSSTWANVRPLLPLLERLCARHGVRVRAVGAGAQAERDRFDGLDLVTWSEASEISEVQAMDIGIMPLLDLPFQRGKSGYKLIQYMACGLPVVASPVGVNSEIVDPANGLLATSEAEWEAALDHLIADPALRSSMGAAGRARAVDAYSLASQAPRLVELFQSIAGRADLAGRA